MWRVLIFVAGAALAAAGIVWTLQGIGYVGGSFMTGQTRWAIIGPVTAITGLVIAVIGVRRRRR